MVTRKTGHYVSGPDHPGITRQELRPHEGVVENLLGQVVDQISRLVGHEESEDQGSEDRAKIPMAKAGYTAPGTYPWICENCRHFSWVLGLPGVGDCTKVEGPHNGYVGPEDSCILFEVGGGLVTPQGDKIPGSDGEED